MNKELFWTGLIMQLVHLVALAVIFINWDLQLIMWVILGTVYALFNIASVIFIIVGALTKK